MRRRFPYSLSTGGLVGRAVFNLINNAMGAINDAVKKRTLELRPFNIWIRASSVQEGEWPEGRYCLLEVRDDGPGIPPKVLESLFTPQVISTTIGGTGIGTRFVKSVADAHGGAVGVESEPGNGARFWLKLPLRQQRSEGMKYHSSSHPLPHALCSTLSSSPFLFRTVRR